ncbi:HipA N-terminal domain-containing protein [Gordonia sp. DT101]|uniref:HipA N-terminal domain-containing protein n=1 Tax=Gordonia sp. DT101 TaxID=3416545 RepID=UPI003CE6E3C2
MTDILQVYMDGARCGEVRQTTRGDLRFVYDEEYRNTRDATPLSLSMPLAISEHRKRVIAPFLDGLITDNETARQSLARRFGVSPNNGFAILSHIGADVAGALQLLPEGVASTDALPRGVYHELADQQVGEMLRGIVDEYRDGRAATANVGQFSLAGAQPKIAPSYIRW